MADFRIGSTKPSKIYLGSTEVKAVYFGSTKIWEAPNADPWVAIITQLKSRTPSLNIDDLESFCEGLYMMMEKGDYDGKAILYWKDEINSNACVIDASEGTLPSGYSGWTYSGDYYADELETYMTINTTKVYLLSANDDYTLSLYYRSSSV